MKEIWKDIKGYNGDYQISNFGKVINKHNKLLKSYKDKNGYLRITLRDRKRYKLHHLVYDAFGEGKRKHLILWVDHFDENKSNNHISNLQLLNNRDNVSKSYLRKKDRKSKYTGVYPVNQKWVAKIRDGKKRLHLGYFNSEYEAHLTYEEAKNNITV